ncbi:unnamed protein product [Rotaria sordida]|uniref:MATH domain-containing protein n=1 Tax=Rotaria sordida TaxID=392033 RepID=A0A814GU62_9BILA|nr:unnamed protein product [Rotaria sordida]
MVGIDARNKNILDTKYTCPKCLLILRDPVQLSTCEYRLCQSCIDTQQGAPIKYPQCQTETPNGQVLLDRGFKSEMQSLPIDCSFCQWSGILNNYQEHLNQSHPNPKCEHCAEQFNSVNKLNEHKVLECQKLSIHCVFKMFGCNEQFIRGKKEEHYLTTHHQEAILKVVRHMRSQLLDTKMETDITRTTTAVTSDPALIQLQEFYETLNILAGGIETLNDDGQRISNELLQCHIKLQTLVEDFSQVKLSVEESHSFLEGVKQNQDILNQDLTSLKEKINDMQYVSYDGTFIWKITNFQEKMTDAQSERQASIYSPPFYSSLTGYKMRARLYINGDGNARRTHMSLFFVLMRSLNDPILKFPFAYKVTFCMYDQTPEQRHIIDSFRPDIRSNSFQRPRSEMNIASGIPKFFPLAMIQQEGNPYVRDDTMFIKVMVDFGDMPKTLLPYSLSLNPGLPMHIQHTMIKQEVERRAQQHPESTPVA